MNLANISYNRHFWNTVKPLSDRDHTLTVLFLNTHCRMFQCVVWRSTKNFRYKRTNWFNIFKIFLGPVDVAIKKYDFHLSGIRMADRWPRLMIMHKKAHDNALDSFFLLKLLSSKVSFFWGCFYIYYTAMHGILCHLWAGVPSFYLQL